MTAMDLAIRIVDGHGLLSQDLSKAFDRLRPEVVEQCLRNRGCPTALVSLLAKLWQSQKRLLKSAQSTLRRWHTYEDKEQGIFGVPQGDSLGVLAMVYALAIPAIHVEMASVGEPTEGGNGVNGLDPHGRQTQASNLQQQVVANSPSDSPSRGPWRTPQSQACS